MTLLPLRGAVIALALAAVPLATACRPTPVSSPLTDDITVGVSTPKERAAPDGAGTPRQDVVSRGLSALVNSLTLEAPVAIAWDGTPVGRVIDEWTWSPDGLTLRLHLQRNVTFHDGTPLTADLAARIIERGLMRPGSNAVSTSVQSVSTSEEDWIEIRTGRPEGFLLSDISILNFSLPDRPNIGTGPFVLRSATPPRLEANAGYRLGAPLVNTVRIEGYETQRAAWAAMMRGEVDVLYDVTSDAVEFVNAESAVRTHSFRRAYYNLLLFNMNHPVLGRREVRIALNEAVDRDEIVKLGLKGKGTAAVGPVWPDHFAVDRRIDDAFRFDRDKAAARLDAIGLPAGLHRVPGQMPSRFSFTCLVVEEDAQLLRIALVMQRQLFELGVDMRVKAMPLDQLMEGVDKQDYEAVLMQFVSTRGLSYVYTFWHSSGPEVRSPFRGTYSGADQALDELRAAVTETAIRAAVPRVQRAFADDPPGVILDWLETSRAVRRNIEVPAEPGRDILGSINRWRPIAPRLASR